VIGISKKTDYAVRILLHLASLSPGTQDSIAAISGRRRLPVAYVRRMIAPLISAGLLRSERGVQGGLSLGRPAGEISLRHIVEAMEGPIALNHCSEVGHTCPMLDACPVAGVWSTAAEVLAAHLDNCRLDQLATSSKRHRIAHRHPSLPRNA
jgi:Rrf2 family protein